MRAIDLLKSAVSMQPQRKTLALPNGTELIWHQTPMTLADRAKAQTATKDGGATEFALQLLVAKAKDENGQPLFTVGDLPDLRRALPADLVEDLLLKLNDNNVVAAGGEELDPKPSRSSLKKTDG